MDCQLTECGFTSSGLRVRAITDMAGAQVVVTNDAKPKDDSLLSKPLENHKAAVSLGERVADNGLGEYNNWQGPVTLYEFVLMIANHR